MLLHEADVVFVGNAAFGNHQRIVRQIRQQADGLLQIHFKRAQIAVVYTAQRRGERRTAFGFGFIVQFQQNRHAQIVRHLFQMAQFCIVQRGGNQQNRICPPGARLIDLVFVQHEIFAQHGQRHSFPRLAQIIGRALEIGFVRQHGQAGCAGVFIGNGMGSGLEICANQAFGRAGFFDFGNDRRLILRMFAAQRGNEIAHGGGLSR